MAFDQLATQEDIEITIKTLSERNIEAIVVDDKEAALAKIKELIPSDVSVMNGSSTTLEQIGLIDYLKSDQHPWNNLHAAIVNEKDEVKQANLRKVSVLSDYYLGSVHALSMTGEFVIASNTGSQMPHIVFTSPNLIFVVGTQKIVSNLSEAMKRLQEYVIPKEDQRMMKEYGVGTNPNKILIFNGEHKMMGRKVRMILVKEPLGF